MLIRLITVSSLLLFGCHKHIEIKADTSTSIDKLETKTSDIDNKTNTVTDIVIDPTTSDITITDDKFLPPSPDGKDTKPVLAEHKVTHIIKSGGKKTEELKINTDDKHNTADTIKLKEKEQTHLSDTEITSVGFSIYFYIGLVCVIIGLATALYIFKRFNIISIIKKIIS